MNLLALKCGLVGVFLLAVFMFGHRIGAKGVQADWDSAKAITVAAQAKLIQEHNAYLAQLQAERDADNVRISTNHEQALKIISDKYDADLAAVRRAGGLRIPRTACGPATTRTETTSPLGRDETPSATIALPEQITSDLFALARDADTIVEQARSCQAWIRQNNFYGVAQ